MSIELTYCPSKDAVQCWPLRRTKWLRELRWDPVGRRPRSHQGSREHCGPPTRISPNLVPMIPPMWHLGSPADSPGSRAPPLSSSHAHSSAATHSIRQLYCTLYSPALHLCRYLQYSTAHRALSFLTQEIALENVMSSNLMRKLAEKKCYSLLRPKSMCIEHRLGV